MSENEEREPLLTPEEIKAIAQRGVAYLDEWAEDEHQEHARKDALWRREQVRAPANLAQEE